VSSPLCDHITSRLVYTPAFALKLARPERCELLTPRIAIRKKDALRQKDCACEIDKAVLEQTMNTYPALHSRLAIGAARAGEAHLRLPGAGRAHRALPSGPGKGSPTGLGPFLSERTKPKPWTRAPSGGTKSLEKGARGKLRPWP